MTMPTQSVSVAFPPNEDFTNENGMPACQLPLFFLVGDASRGERCNSWRGSDGILGQREIDGVCVKLDAVMLCTSPTWAAVCVSELA